MEEKSKQIYLLIFLVFILILLNYNFLNKKTEEFLDIKDFAKVDRVIDGDTIVIGNSTSVRLLGINTPERGEFFYSEAKEFLESFVLNKTILLEYGKNRYDKYGRTLAYLYINSENVNLKLVENGFANYYFYDGRDKYSDSFEEAWKKCVERNINLCKASINPCSSCIKIKYSGIINSCNLNCNVDGWEIKGEGRKKFLFNGILKPDEEIKFELDLTNSGGSLFLRDGEGKLVEWKSY